MRTALAAAAPQAMKNQWKPLQQLVDRVASPRRFVVELLVGFSAFALILAAIGIVIGAVASVVLARSLRGLLFGVSWSDPVRRGARSCSRMTRGAGSWAAIPA
jgi:mannitol-specific phosphotransferase system IIBC component